MFKKALTRNQMTDVAYIDDAARWSKELTRLRSRGPGDTENAMREIERAYGVDYWVLWRLRYRRDQIKDVGVSIYMRLREAYQTECDRQLRKLHHEIRTTEIKTGPDSAHLRAAKALVGETD